MADGSFDPLAKLVSFNIYKSNGGELPLDEWMLLRGFEQEEREATRTALRESGADPTAWATFVP